MADTGEIELAQPSDLSLKFPSDDTIARRKGESQFDELFGAVVVEVVRGRGVGSRLVPLFIGWSDPAPTFAGTIRGIFYWATMDYVVPTAVLLS